MDLDEIRDTLFQAMDQQREADIAANNTNQLLGQQKIMYANDARGTLYSGQPTWERAQLAATGATNLAKINSEYMKNKLNVWNSITNTLDQINSYNKAAAAMSKAASNVSSATPSGQTYLEYYNSLTGETD